MVSAIGHEQDAPLLDLVADFRASTPTDAAKRIVPSWTEQSAIVSAMQARAGTVLRSRLDRERSLAQELRRRIRARLANQIEGAGRDVEHLAARVRALSPAATLDRGYAIVTTATQSIIRDASEVTAGQRLQVRVAKGSFSVEARPNPAEES